MQSATDYRNLYAVPKQQEPSPAPQVLNELDEELCATNGHSWPVPGFFGRADPTIREEAKLHSAAIEECRRINEKVNPIQLPRYYHQKGTQSCERCRETRKVYREIMISLCGGSTGKWIALTPAKEAEIDNDPPRGENPFPAIFGTDKLFQNTDASKVL